jgi:hypothetical protein
MESLFIYLWKSAAIITLFYGFYKLLLQKETHFKSNRYFLFSGILASLIIPLIIIPRYVQIETIQSTIVEGTINTAAESSTQTIHWLVILLYGYIIITAALIVKFILQLLSIAILIRKGEIKKIDNFYHVKTSTDTSPFSFFNFIVFNPNQFNENELDHILNHEKVHALQKHSFDTILSHILTAIQWFNPLVWLYKKDIAENLEFLADEYAQKTSSSENSYQQLLLKTTVPNYQMALANNFYNSLLKKRIIMLHKQRSNSNSHWKYALMIPLLLAFVFTFNTKTIAQQKKIKITKEKIDVFAMGITKKSTKAELNNIIKLFSEKGLNVKFNNVKRNSDNEITSIKVDAKAKSGKASAAYASDLKDGINPIQISFDNENNNLSIGSSDGHGYSFSDNGHKIMRYAGGGKANSFVFISDDEDHESNTNVWVTKDGDTTKIIKKNIIVEIDEEHTDDVKHKFIIKEDHDGDEIKTEVIKIRGAKGKAEKHIIFSSDDEDDENTITTYIVNGKKMTKEEFKKFDKEKIKSIEIKKEKIKKKN